MHACNSLYMRFIPYMWWKSHLHARASRTHHTHIYFYRYKHSNATTRKQHTRNSQAALHVRKTPIGKVEYVQFSTHRAFTSSRVSTAHMHMCVCVCACVVRVCVCCASHIHKHTSTVHAQTHICVHTSRMKNLSNAVARVSPPPIHL